MVENLADARRHLKEAEARSGDEIDRVEAVLEKLQGENDELNLKAKPSEDRCREALSSGSVHTYVWDKSPETREAQLLAIKETGELLLRGQFQGGQEDGRCEEEEGAREHHNG